MKSTVILKILFLVLTLSVNAQSSIFNTGGYGTYRMISNPKSDFVDLGGGFRFNFFIPKDSKFSVGIYGDFLSYNVNRDLQKHVEQPSDYFNKTIGNYSSVCLGSGANRLNKFGERPFILSYGANSGLNFTTRNSFKTYFINEDGSTTTIVVDKRGLFKSIGIFVAPYADLILKIRDFGLHLGTTLSYRYSNFSSIYMTERLGEISSTTIKEKFHILDMGIYFGFTLDIAEW